MTSSAAPPAFSQDIAALRYPIGFLLGRIAGPAPPTYRPVEFPVPLLVHPRTRCGVGRTAERVVAIIGEAVHPDRPQLDLAGLAAWLASSGADVQQASIDGLVGRFVVVYGSSQGFSLQTDAIGMRAVFFAPGADGVVAASHALLVAAATGRSAQPAPQPYSLGWPGIGTPYAGVLRVPPNVELDLSTAALRRFFPLAPLPQVAIDDAWSFAFERAAAAVAAWASRHRLLLSLTGGLDSRTTLAATRHSWPRLEFFTYDRGEPSQQVDMRVARDIASRLALKHHCVEYADDDPDPALLAVVKLNSFGNHGRKLACAYLRRFGHGDYLHVRTNLLEIGRANLYASNDRLPSLAGGPDTAERMAEFYAKAGRLAPQPHMLAEFVRYVTATDFPSAADCANPWDLYFVEHRMGAWHAGIVLESDIAFDTVIAFNSREIVRRLMGVPPSVRAGSRWLVQKLADALPELAGIPVNPRTWPAVAA
jgi:hypothetical protein